MPLASSLRTAEGLSIVTHAAVLDTLSRGHFIFRISSGSLTSDAKTFGILDDDRNRMFAESIEALLEIWNRQAPCDIDLPGNRWKVSTSRTQQPHPEIVGTVMAPSLQGVVAMGQRDLHPLFANCLL